MPLPAPHKRHLYRGAIAWSMAILGIIATPIGLWLTDEPPMIVIMSGAALVFEGLIALLVVSSDRDRDRPPDND